VIYFCEELSVLDQILNDMINSVVGASAAMFLDGDGEYIVQAGESDTDMKIMGAWKEIHLDRIKEITGRLQLGSVKAVLFSLDRGNELIVPVEPDYCLILFMSSYTDIRQAMTEVEKAIVRIKKDIE
jgi:predicted regulator of Ras-like GTPase activity (Roadblock/LC7/MglB family)